MLVGTAPAASRNVALSQCGTTIEASDSESGASVQDAESNKPQNLIDGIINPPSLKRWHSDTGKRHPHWLWLHFVQPVMAEKIVLYPSDLNCFPIAVKISCQDKGAKWIELVSTKIEPAASVPIEFPPTRLDNLRIEILESSSKIAGNPNFTQLNELEVYAEIGNADYEALIARQRETEEAREKERMARHIRIREIKEVDAMAKERRQWLEKNVALARLGTSIEASPHSGNSRPQNLIDGIINYSWKNAWRSDHASKHPHDLCWSFARPFQVNRVVLSTTVLHVYFPTVVGLSWRDKNGQWEEIVPPTRISPALSVIFEFQPMLVDNLRLEILESKGKWHGNPNIEELNEIEVYAVISEREYQTLMDGQTDPAEAARR
jgi:hypothetical protein